MPVLRLQAAGFMVTGWFMNPNIQPLAEYLRRREAALQCAEALKIDLICDDASWDISAWLSKASSYNSKEQRCAFCCQKRIEALCDSAVTLGIDSVSSSLLYSRYQPHDLVAKAGANYASAAGLKFIYKDFRLDWQEGIERSKELGLYRQPYCGCIFSEAERYSRKLARLAAIKNYDFASEST